MARSRSRRFAKQAAQEEKFSRSQVSTRTRPALSASEASKAFSRVESRGGENSPAAIKRSKAPFPSRVGIRETTVAPHEKANAADLTAHSTASFSARKGGLTRMKARRAI